MFVNVTETYDLSTKIGKMGLVGIHTPEGKLVHKMWSGLYQNFRKIRFVSCDVALACASMLPADPLQIGVEAGSIAPQDMFNPILYKPVSNDSMSQLLNRLYLGSMASTVDVAQNSVIASNNADYGSAGASVGDGHVLQATNTPSQFDMYYALLADTDGWKKAMPQAGLVMRGLYPLVWSMLKTSGQPSNWSSSIQQQSICPSGTDYLAGASVADLPPQLGALGQYMRGPSRRMPACDTYVAVYSSGEVMYVPNKLIAESRNNDVTYPIESTAEHYSDTPISTYTAPNLDMPDCFVGAIVLPPATLNQLYYRLKVTWHVEFSEPRPLTDLTNWFGLQVVGQQAYGTDYTAQTQALRSSGDSVSLGMLDADGIDAKKVMEGSK